MSALDVPLLYDRFLAVFERGGTSSAINKQDFMLDESVSIKIADFEAEGYGMVKGLEVPAVMVIAVQSGKSALTLSSISFTPHEHLRNASATFSSVSVGVVSSDTVSAVEKIVSSARTINYDNLAIDFDKPVIIPPRSTRHLLFHSGGAPGDDSKFRRVYLSNINYLTLSIISVKGVQSRPDPTIFQAVLNKGGLVTASESLNVMDDEFTTVAIADFDSQGYGIVEGLSVPIVMLITLRAGVSPLSLSSVSFNLGRGLFEGTATFSSVSVGVVTSRTATDVQQLVPNSIVINNSATTIEFPAPIVIPPGSSKSLLFHSAGTPNDNIKFKDGYLLNAAFLNRSEITVKGTRVAVDNDWMQLNGMRVESSICVIGDDRMFAIELNTRDIVQYHFANKTWTKVSGPVLSTVGTEQAIYVLVPSPQNSEKKALKKMGTADDNWVQLGDIDFNAKSLVVAGGSLYALDERGFPYEFLSETNVWRSISTQGLLTSMVATASVLYGLNLAKRVYPRYGGDERRDSWFHESNDVPGVWERLVTTDDTLYAVNVENNLYRYRTPPNGEVPWELVSEYADGYWANSGHLFKSVASANSLYYFADKTWKRVGNALESMVIGRKYIIGIRNSIAYAFIAITTEQATEAFVAVFNPKAASEAARTLPATNSDTFHGESVVLSVSDPTVPIKGAEIAPGKSSLVITLQSGESTLTLTELVVVSRDNFAVAKSLKVQTSLAADSHKASVVGNYVISPRVGDTYEIQTFTFATPISVSPGAAKVLILSSAQDLTNYLLNDSEISVKGTRSRTVPSSPLVRRILAEESKTTIKPESASTSAPSSVYGIGFRACFDLHSAGDVMQLEANNWSDFLFRELCTLSCATARGESIALNGNPSKKKGIFYIIKVTAGCRNMSLTTLTVRSKRPFEKFDSLMSISVMSGSFTPDGNSTSLELHAITNSGGRYILNPPVIIPANTSMTVTFTTGSTVPDLYSFFSGCEISIAGFSENKSILDGATAIRLKFPGTNTSSSELFTMKKSFYNSSTRSDTTINYDFQNNNFWRVVKATDGKGYNLMYDGFAVHTYSQSDNARGISVVNLYSGDQWQPLSLQAMVDTNNHTFRLHYSDKDMFALAVWKRNHEHWFVHADLPIDVDEDPVYGHWEITDNIHYEDWVKFDGDIRSVICVVGDRVFATAHPNRICSYNLTTKLWKNEHEGETKSIAGNEEGVYIMFSYITAYNPIRNKTHVMKMGPSDTTWVEVVSWVKAEGDQHIASLFAAGPNLYGVDNQGKAFQWNNTSSTWDDLNNVVALNMLVGCGSQLYALSADKRQVFMRNDGTHTYKGVLLTDPWLRIGDAMTTLLATDDALYGVDEGGSLQQHHFDGVMSTWKVVSEPSASGFWAGNRFVIKASASTDEMHVFHNETWTRVDGAVDSVVFGRTLLFGLRGVTPYYMPITSLLADKSDRRIVSHNRNLWLFTFTTTRDSAPEYWGTVHVTVYDSISNCEADFTLEKVGFYFGGQSNTFEFELPAKFTTLTGMSICSTMTSTIGKNAAAFLDFIPTSIAKKLADKWHLSDVRAVSKRSAELFTVDFNCVVAVVTDATMLDIIQGKVKVKDVGSNGTVSTDIRPLGHILRCSPRPSISCVANVSHVHFWKDDKRQSRPWQYVSMTLPNGYYVSFKEGEIGYGRYKSLAEDILTEPRKTPDMTFAIILPDVAAAASWYAQKPPKKYDSFDNNSANIVKKVVEKGGGFNCLSSSIRNDRYLDYDAYWTVDRLLSIIVEIAVAQSD